MRVFQFRHRRVVGIKIPFRRISGEVIRRFALNGRTWPARDKKRTRHVKNVKTLQSPFRGIISRMAKKPAKNGAKRGPKPETLPPFNGTFEQAVDLALSKKRPPGGWPKLSARKRK